MAKAQTNEQKEDSSKLSAPTVPVLKADTSVSNAELIAGTTTPPAIEHNPSEYLLVSIGKDGEEGTPFNIGVATFNRVFLPLTTGEDPSFLVKKSPAKP